MLFVFGTLIFYYRKQFNCSDFLYEFFNNILVRILRTVYFFNSEWSELAVKFLLLRLKKVYMYSKDFAGEYRNSFRHPRRCLRDDSRSSTLAPPPALPILTLPIVATLRIAVHHKLAEEAGGEDLAALCLDGV